MPDNCFEVNIGFFPFLSLIFWDLKNLISIYELPILFEKKVTIGCHPTTRPPPIPSPFRIQSGRLAHLAIIG